MTESKHERCYDNGNCPYKHRFIPWWIYLSSFGVLLIGVAGFARWHMGSLDAIDEKYLDQLKQSNVNAVNFQRVAQDNKELSLKYKRCRSSE